MSSIEILKLRSIELFGFQPLPDSEIHKIEHSLGIQLPDDLKRISQFYSGGYCGDFDYWSPSNSLNFVDETLRLRTAISLPNKYIFLAEPPESGVFLEIGSQSKVIWCDAVEVDKLSSGNFENKPDIWNSYKDYFEYLLGVEEEERTFE